MARPLSIGMLKKEGTEPWLYETLRLLIQSSKDTQRGQAAVVRGEVPDGSGDPLPAPDLTPFFLLAGRTPGQVAYGANGEAGNLTLGSTSNSTKGKILFGIAGLSAYSETNNLWGFGTATPTARLHLTADTNSLYTLFEPPTFTVLSCTVSSLTTLTTSVSSGFQPNGGPRVMPGMLVTGTGIPVGTYVSAVTGSATLTLSQNATNGLAGTCTFSTNTDIEKVSDETMGISLAIRSRAGVRFLVGPPNSSNDVPFTINGDFRTFAANSSAVPRVYLETGYLSSAAAFGTDLQIGGPAHGELARLYLSSRVIWMQRNNAISTTTAVGVGINPAEFGAGGGFPGGGFVVGGEQTNNILSVAGAGTTWHIVCGVATSGTSPNKTFDVDSNYIFRVGASAARVYFGNAAGSGTYTAISAGSLSFLRASNDTIQFAVSANVTGWTDSASTYAFSLGSFVTETSARRAWLSSSGNGVLLRLGLASVYTAIGSNRAAGLPAPSATPECLQVFNGDLDGDDASVVLAVKSLRSGQTGDLQQWRSSSTTLGVVTAAGKHGILTTAPTNELSFGGNAARKLWMERHTTSNTAGNNLTIQAGGATSGATNKNGGQLILMAGTSTGTGTSTITFQTSTTGSSGTSDNAPSTKLSIAGSGAMTHTVSSFAADGLSQTINISSGVSATEAVAFRMTPTYTNVVDSAVTGLFMQLSVTTDSTDAGGSGIGAFGFQVYEDGESGTGANATVVGGFLRHSSTAAGLTFTGVNIGFQSASGSGSADYYCFFSGTSGAGLGSSAASFTGFRATDAAIASGTLTNQYGLYIDDLTTATNNFAIFSAGTTKSVLGGKLALGSTTSPAETLDLFGNIKITDTTNGTKIGTATSQKLAFWNAAPIVQPTTAVASATRVGGGGTTVTDTDTFDGYTIGQVVKALRNEGLLA